MGIASSELAQAVEPSLSRHLFNLAKQYENVIDLTLGDPDLLPALEIRQAACEAVQSGHTHYSANAGLKELRDVIAKMIRKEYGLDVNPDKQIIVTVGGMEALYLALACSIDRGDEVIIPGPYYVNYVQMVRMCGGVPIIVDTFPENGFVVSRDDLERVVTTRTRLLILNNPANPTGATIPGSVLQDIADFVTQHDLIVVADEVYKTLVYEGDHESILCVPDMADRTVLIDSVSKRFSMTGYRLGFAAGPSSLIADMTKVQENVAACAPLPSQYAAIEAYANHLNDDEIFKVFESRRRVVLDSLKGINGIQVFEPAGAFYLFIDVSGTGLSGEEFAYALLEEEQVAVVPGITYGASYGDYVRVAYTVDSDTLQEACRRLTGFVDARML